MQTTKEEFIENVIFPDPLMTARNDGPFAIGGDLSNEFLDQAYSIGAFPFWSYYDHEDYEWWCPRNRFVIIPEEIHISHSMQQLIKSGKYRVSVNEDFDGVIDGCSQTNGRDQEECCWLKGEIVDAYKRYHREGHAMSVEVWDGDRLVGGLYGGMLGNCFAGESMFSLVPSASKLALIHVAKMLQGTGKIIDCHFETDHLRSMGGRYMLLSDFLRILRHRFVGTDARARLAERDWLMKDEKLLRTARNYPIHECYLVNQVTQFKYCNVFITRKVNSNNFIIVDFLLDLFHEGIINCYITMNATEEQYQDFIEKHQSLFVEIEKIDYPKAHAYIYKAREWGKAVGITNDRFFSFASNILDCECGEAEHLMDDLPFGIDGKYVIDTDPNNCEEQKAFLNKMIGEDNYLLF